MTSVPEQRGLGRSAFYKAAVIAIALWLCWISIAVSIPNALRNVNPGLASAVAPGDARTLALRAKLIADARPDRAGLSDAGRLAARVIARDPTIAFAVSVAGFAAESRGDAGRAKSLLLASERLSRRDLPAQLWLIEDAVRRDDAPGALRHYDIALRTSKLAPSILYPVLIGATDDQTLLAPLARVLAPRPPWAHPFLAQLLVTGRSPENLVRLAHELRRAGAPMVEGLERILLKRLIDERRFDLALDYYVAAGGAPLQAASDGVNDPRFQERADYFPFGWDLVDTPDLYSRMGVKDAGEPGLSFHADAGRGGEVVRQLLTLAPGRYVIRTGSTGGELGQLDRPAWTIRCVDDARTIVRLELVGGAGERSFEVPADCSWQSLALVVRPVDDPDGVSGTVEFVSIRKAGKGIRATA